MFTSHPAIRYLMKLAYPGSEVSSPSSRQNPGRPQQLAQPDRISMNHFQQVTSDTFEVSRPYSALYAQVGKQRSSEPRPWSLTQELTDRSGASKDCLDIGCGSSYKTVVVAHLFRSVTGLDPSEENVNVRNGFWKTRLSLSALLNILNSTPIIRNFSQTRDHAAIQYIQKRYSTPQNEIETTENRILVTGSKPTTIITHGATSAAQSNGFEVT